MMTHQGLERQLQTVYRPSTGALAECVAAIRAGDMAQQRAALHKLKGTLLLLGLEKLANCCEAGEEQLKMQAPQPLPADWTESLQALAEQTREELTAHFQLAA